METSEIPKSNQHRIKLLLDDITKNRYRIEQIIQRLMDAEDKEDMMYLKERIIEVDEEGEGKVVNKSASTSFIRIEKMEDRKRAKGVKRAVNVQHLRHSHFKDTSMSLGEYTVSQNLMRSQDVTDRNVKKVALTGYDIGRWYQYTCS